ncbi:hypothetical protein NDU88_005153 [Pleurodeles waltl]|uniref:Uncharacterized protein n=1 Tax=Pleurodeles waltl TaxID=8319 RepID=A0AAV7MZB5_PLEWA|nr:hypothetical protein NDU88_005153 [Pleurodeles waltl]
MASIAALRPDTCSSFNPGVGAGFQRLRSPCRVQTPAAAKFCWREDDSVLIFKSEAVSNASILEACLWTLLP